MYALIIVVIFVLQSGARRRAAVDTVRLLHLTINLHFLSAHGAHIGEAYIHFDHVLQHKFNHICKITMVVKDRLF